MIGVKTLVVVGLAAITVTIAILEGALELERLAELSGGSAFAIGLFASAAAALVGIGWRPELASRAAVAAPRGKPQLVLEPEQARVRELPALVQRGLLVIVFAIIALGSFGNEATARVASFPDELATPSRAAYCQPELETADEPAPEPVIEEPVDQAGCALVKRAFELGYAKSLGSCAPKVVKVASPAIEREREVCTGRQLDEPFLHFAYRKVAEMAGDSAPIATSSRRIDEFRTRMDYVGDLLRDIEHSVTGTPHASHHLWVTLPDPRPRAWHDVLSVHVPCASHYAELALWPRWTEATSPSAAFEHVLGQLLFATRFGTVASCSDYTIHWGAPADACTRLAADPAGFLDDHDALESIRAVLDRRNRQLAMHAMSTALGRPPTLPLPPPTSHVVSASCFIIDQAGTGQASGRSVMLDGEEIAIRELRAPALRVTGAGPIDLYTQLARLLGGIAYAGPATASADRSSAEPPPASFEATDYPLLRLEPLVEADPFLGARAALETEVTEVYPIERHLQAFIDAFRRHYLPQRGRL